MRTAAAVACGKPPPKYHCLYWRYLCSIAGVATACITGAPGVAAAAEGGAAARGGGGPQEAIQPSRSWSTIM